MSEAQAKYPNLINNSDLTPEKRRQMASNGGKKGAKIQKQKKMLKDTINEFLKAINPATGNPFQIDLVDAMLKKAILDGDVAAFNTLRDTSGQKPKEDVQVVNMPIINIKGL